MVVSADFIDLLNFQKSIQLFMPMNTHHISFIQKLNAIEKTKKSYSYRKNKLDFFKETVDRVSANSLGQLIVGGIDILPFHAERRN